MAIKNLFKDRVKPKQAIAYLTSKFKQDNVTKNNTQSRGAIANLVSKLPFRKSNHAPKEEIATKNSSNLELKKAENSSNNLSAKDEKTKQEIATENNSSAELSENSSNNLQIEQNKTAKEERETAIQKELATEKSSSAEIAENSSKNFQGFSKLIAKLPNFQPKQTANSQQPTANNKDLETAIQKELATENNSSAEIAENSSKNFQGFSKLIAKLPNFQPKQTANSQQQTANNKDLETDIEKVDRSLIKGVNHEKILAIFRRMARNAKPENIEKIVENLPKMNRGAVKKVWTQVQSLLATIRDPNTAWKSKTLAIAALVYLISPFDAIPDVLPGIGLTDDVALIVAVVSSFASELSQYVEKSADKGLKVASELADIEVKKYNKIVRIGLIGSILAGIIAILVQFIIKQMA